LDITLGLKERKKERKKEENYCGKEPDKKVSWKGKKFEASPVDSRTSILSSS